MNHCTSVFCPSETPCNPPDNTHRETHMHTKGLRAISYDEEGDNLQKIWLVQEELLVSKQFSPLVLHYNGLNEQAHRFAHVS